MPVHHPTDGELLGVFFCGEHCGCCKQPQEFTVYGQNEMRCRACGCRFARADSQTYFRLFLKGRLSMEAVEQVMKLARLLGADDKDYLMTDKDDPHLHYIEIDPALMLSNVEFRQVMMGTKEPPI